MIRSTIPIRSRYALLLALALTAACKVNESGAIPCNDDSNCPGDYPQCIGATGSAPGKCTEAVIGKPGLAATTIAVAPAAITGGVRPGVSLALPALTGDVNLARKVTLEISSGAAKEAVVKAGGAAVTLADLGTTVTVDAPATAATDEKTYTYTLTVSNAPGSTDAVTATGTLGIVPAPALASGALVVSPSSVPSGIAPTLSVTLPALSSPPSSASIVVLSISGCGSGPVTKSGGGAVSASDLGNTISIDSPASAAGDSKTCTYTLTVSNAATTPASASAAGTLTIEPFVITSQPANVNATVGGSASFSVATSVTQGTVTYQWQKGGLDLAGKTSSTLTFNPVAAGDAGLYTVVVTNTINAKTVTLTSTAASLNVAPVISAQPASITAPEGGNASFSVTASVSAPSTLTYQWMKGGTPLTDGGSISGATTANLTITGVVAGDAGTYSVVATSNLNGTTNPTTSSNATLTVNRDPTISSQPSSQTVPQGNNATFSVTASAPSPGATLSYQWQKNGTNLTNGGNVSGATSATLTLTSVTGTDEATYTVVVTSHLNSTLAPVTSNGAVLTVNQTPVVTPLTNQTVPQGNTATITVTATAPSAGATLSYQWKKGATTLTDGGNISGSTTATLTISNVTSADQATYSVVVTSNLNSTTKSAPSVSMTLTVNRTPIISLQPASQTVPEGNTASFSVAASAPSAGATLSYQWMKGATALTNTGNVTGATTSTLSLANVTAADEATYTVVVTSNLNSTTSSATSNGAVLTVNQTPIITGPTPAGQAPAAGSTITIGVTATAPSAGATLTYQWMRGITALTDTGNVSGSTTNTLTLTNVSSTDAGTYTVVVTSSLNATVAPATSNPAVVVFPPAISAQPASQVAAQGSTAQFSVTATGPGGATLSYQWRKNGLGLANGGKVSGATTSTLSLANAGLADVALYDVVVTSTLNATTATTTSSSAALTVDNALDTAIQRVGATATLLPNGKVLIAGGANKSSNTVCRLASATNLVEIFDPATGVSTQLGGATPAANQHMTQVRCQHAAVLVGTKVYFFGGTTSANIDVFDTTNNTFATTSLPALSTARFIPTATLLGAASGTNSGKVVIAGGYDVSTGNALPSIELFTPGSSPATTYTAQLGGGAAGSGRGDHTATLAGKWLFFIGGLSGTASSTSVTSSVDAIDTTLNPTGAGAATIVNSTPSSNGVARWAHSAVALSSGNAILLIGGLDSAGKPIKSVQTYAVNTTTGSASGAASTSVNMNTARAYFPVLPSQTADKFVVFGGTATVANPDTGTTSIELIDATNAASIATSLYLGDVVLGTARLESGAVVIDNGGTPAFFVAGGDPGNNTAAAGSEEVIFDQ